jgi:hypothetical protein
VKLPPEVHNMIKFQGREVARGEVQIEVKYSKPILAGVAQTLNVWQDYMKVNDQDLAELAEELIDDSPYDGSEYRIKGTQQ